MRQLNRPLSWGWLPLIIFAKGVVSGQLIATTMLETDDGYKADFPFAILVANTAAFRAKKARTQMNGIKVSIDFWAVKVIWTTRVGESNKFRPTGDETECLIRTPRGRNGGDIVLTEEQIGFEKRTRRGRGDEYIMEDVPKDMLVALHNNARSNAAAGE